MGTIKKIDEGELNLLLLQKAYKIKSSDLGVFEEWVIMDRIATRYGMNPKEVYNTFDESEVAIILKIIHAENEASKPRS